LELPIVGVGVVIDRLVPADAPALAASHSDHDNARYQDWPTPLSEADALAFIETVDEQLAIRETAGGPLAGDLYVARPDDKPGVVEVGITLVPGFHGRGVATAAVRALLDVLLADAEVQRVEAVLDVDNDRSRALFERLGFQLEARLEGTGERRDGSRADELVYALAVQ
jgi:RimJ/RimL family protein N-acetyltransferase